MALLTMPVSFTPLALIALLVTPETAIAAVSHTNATHGVAR